MRRPFSVIKDWISMLLMSTDRSVNVHKREKEIRPFSQI